MAYPGGDYNQYTSFTLCRYKLFMFQSGKNYTAPEHIEKAN